jgi:glycosyltransferase involved in cell wall biosynthesis
VRLAAYTDYAYHRVGEQVYGERAFAIFLGRLRESFDRLVLVGRLSPPGGEARYAIGEDVELAALPYYPALSRPFEALPALGRSLAVFWHVLARVDCVWLLGPHPLAIAFALLAAGRRKRVVLGVRQDLPAYVASRHPGRRGLLAAAHLLEWSFRALARAFPTIAVGPELAHNYRHSRRVLQIAVSLVESGDVVDPTAALARDYGGELRSLVVGRLEQEKNPLLLADVLADLNRDGGRWRLLVCGEGELRASLGSRLVELGQADRAQLLGYVAFGPRLMDLYRSSHALLHMSSTEGLPQVLLEAFAAGLPVVASEVGGIRGAVGDAALLIPPGDAFAAAAARRAVAAEPTLRARLVRAGHEYVASRTIDAEVGRVAGFLADPR